MAKKMEKTNVMRLLDQKKVPYESYCYIDAATTVGTEVAAVLGQDPNQVFKTLVTVGGKTKQNFVFVIPVNRELDLKKAASAVGEKSIEMTDRPAIACDFSAGDDKKAIAFCNILGLSHGKIQVH